jgi:hypothetical protein
MRKLKTILVASLVAASLYAAAGTAWAKSDMGHRGTSWTDDTDTTVPTVPTVPDIGILGISWE